MVKKAGIGKNKRNKKATKKEKKEGICRLL
jgi:hypothetical protein